MPSSNEDGLHNVITSAWNARSSPGDWTAGVLDWSKAAGYPPRKLSATLCGMCTRVEKEEKVITSK